MNAAFVQRARTIMVDEIGAEFVSSVLAAIPTFMKRYTMDAAFAQESRIIALQMAIGMSVESVLAGSHPIAIEVFRMCAVCVEEGKRRSPVVLPIPRIVLWWLPPLRSLDLKS